MLLSKKFVVPGDNLSPITFDMSFNTLIRTIKNEKIKLMGFNYTNTLSICHWFQFADNTALATAVQEDSQALLYVFSNW